MFPWARFREQKGAVKVHTLIDLHGNIPVFVRITDGKVHDVNILDQLSVTIFERTPILQALQLQDNGENHRYFLTS
jgi:hypothetical protein